MAQHARPNVTGQMAERRAHCTTFSRLVVSTGISKSVSSPITVSLDDGWSRWRSVLVVGVELRSPVEDPFAPDIDVADHKDQEKHDDLNEPRPRQLAHRHRPRIQKGDFDVE